MANLIIFRNEYDKYEDLEHVINYVNNKKRADYIGGQNILLGDSIEQAMAVNNFFYNETKRKAFHFAISFDDDEVMIAQHLYEEGYNICALLPEYQIIFAIHQETGHIHMHFAINPISLCTGRKLCFDNTTFYGFVNGVREIFKQYDVKIGVIWD